MSAGIIVGSVKKLLSRIIAHNRVALAAWGGGDAAPGASGGPPQGILLFFSVLVLKLYIVGALNSVDNVPGGEDEKR